MAEKKQKLTVAEWIIGGLSFVPGLGVILGLVSVVLGGVRFRAGGLKLIYLGLGGVLFNVIVYGLLFYVVFTEKINKGSPFQELAEMNLVNVVKSLEYHKLIHGEYPAELGDLMKDLKSGSGAYVIIYDSSSGAGFGNKMQAFQYVVLEGGKSYYLFGVGPDGIAGTSDDVFPKLSEEELDHIGYRKKQ